MNFAPIRKYVTKTKQIDPTKLGRSTIVYIDISSLDKDTKTIFTPSVIPANNAPSRARKIVCEGDVIVSTVRPNLNSVALVPARYNGEIASTGFCVLRAIRAELDPIYLFYFTQTEAFINRLTQLSIGAGYPAVSDEDILDAEILLPPLLEQQRMAAILVKADHLRRLRRYALDLGESYLQSVFLEMFGDPAANPKRWPIGIIEDVVTSTQYGTSEKSNSEHKGYPVLGMGNITYSGEIDLTNLAYVDLSSKEFEKLRLQPGDIIFNRTNSTELVGKTACWKYNLDAVIASYLVRIKLNDEILPDYFASLLNTRYFKGLLQERCKKAVGQSNISPTLLQEFPVLKPSIPLQQKFAQIVHKYERLHAQQREAARQTEHLFQTLLHRAFAGEL